MNNFVFSQDPLLYTTMSSKQLPQVDYEMKRQLDEAMAQYQAMASGQNLNGVHKNVVKDYLGEIDEIIRGLDGEVIALLGSDEEYLRINEELQQMIQEEMMKSVKMKINSNSDAVSKMGRLKEIIVGAKKQKAEEDRRVMADINDYIKNFSDLTFDEYKELKYNK